MTGDGVGCPRVAMMGTAGFALSLTSHGAVDFGGAGVLPGDRDVLAAFDPSGNYLWNQILTKGYASVATNADSIAALAQITGPTKIGDTQLAPTDGNDLVLGRFNFDGTVKWVRVVTTPGAGTNGGIVGLAPSGMIVGSIEGPLDLMGTGEVTNSIVAWDADGNALWQRAIAPYNGASALDQDSNTVVAQAFSSGASLGDHQILGAGMFVAKLDPAGSELWLSQFSDNTGGAPGVRVLLNGDILLTFSQGDAWRLNSNGERIRKFRLYPSPIALHDGTFVTTATSGQTSGQTAVVVKWSSPTGELLAQSTLPLGKTLGPLVCGVAADDSDAVYVSGGVDPDVNERSTRAFVVKLTR